MTLYNLLLHLGFLWHIDKRRVWWPIVVLAVVALVASTIYQFAQPTPSAVTVTISADQLASRHVETVIVQLGDEIPELVRVGDSATAVVEVAPHCVAHYESRRAGEPTWVWCEDGMTIGRVDATLARWAVTWQDGDEAYNSATWVVARAYAWPGYGGATLTITTGISTQCEGGVEYWLSDLEPLGWANVTSSFNSFGNCGEGVLYSGINYMGFGGSCTPGCIDLRDVNFDNSAESLKVRQ